MKVSVITPTYKRGWSLPYMLNSLKNQTVKPDEIIIVLKKSGDESENIIKNYNDLPIKLIIQKEGNVVQALGLGIKNAQGDILVSIDDDAIAEPMFIEKYLHFFSEIKKAGAASGKVYIAQVDKYGNQKIIHELPDDPDTHKVFWRNQLRNLEKYCEGISISGFNYKYNCNNNLFYRASTSLIGTNMAFRSEAINGLNLSDLFKNSHAGYHYESLLAYYVVLNGYSSYKILNKEIAPIVFHIEHIDSITRSKGWKNEFWKHYDRVKQFHRLRKMKADVSWMAYIIACLVALRKHTLPRLLATAYAQLV